MLDDVLSPDPKTSICSGTVPPFSCWCLNHYPNTWGVVTVMFSFLLLLLWLLMALSSLPSCLFVPCTTEAPSSSLSLQLSACWVSRMWWSSAIFSVTMVWGLGWWAPLRHASVLTSREVTGQKWVVIVLVRHWWQDQWSGKQCVLLWT